MSDTVKSGQGDEDVVTLTKKEHDELQGRLRVLEKDAKERKAQVVDAKLKAENEALAAQLEAAQKAGVGKEQKKLHDENADLRSQLQKVRTDNAIRDAIDARSKWSTSAQRAALKMVDTSRLDQGDDGIPTEESVNEALDILEKDFPEIYGAGGKAPGDKDKSGDRDKGGRKAVQTPSTPSALGDEAGAKFEGFISPEEYTKTPWEVRQTPEFRERVKKSEPFWPTHITHRDFQ